MRFLLPTALAVLAFAAPAWASGEPVCFGTNDAGMPVACPDTSSGQTVGDGDVITDPADEVEQPGERGEIHVLAETRGSTVATSHATDKGSGSAAAQPAASSTPAPASASSQPAAAVKTVARHRRHNGARELPFTGIDAWMLALGGLILLEAGLRLRRLAK
jgi:hypothetical protein